MWGPQVGQLLLGLLLVIALILGLAWLVRGCSSRVRAASR